MASHQEIYRQHPAQYEELVRAEDTDGNLRRELEAVCKLKDARVAEAGAGTGRLTRLFLRSGASEVFATEVEPAMLRLAQESLGESDPRLKFAQADARRLPIESDWADLSVAGWVLGHFRGWMPEDWKPNVRNAIDELNRVTRRGGPVVVIETLGTGANEPAPPNPALAEYYGWMEEELGFQRRAFRTDYLFESVEEAARITGFFFGQAFENRVRSERWDRVPECTGLWHRTKT